MMDKIKNLLDQWVAYILNKSGKKENVSIYQVFDDIQVESIAQLEWEEKKPLKEQLKTVLQPDKKKSEYWIYIFQNLLNPLYLFNFRDYSTGSSFNWIIRWGNKVEAWENAMKIYKLKNLPDKIIDIEVPDDRLLDKLIVKPTFFLTKKVDKWQLWEFLVEYSSLLSDWFNKKDTIDTLKDIIKDKALLEFMEALKTSNYTMSTLMEKSGMFDDYTISIIESSELAWWDTRLYQGLTQLWISYKKEDEFKRSFIKSLYYPVFLLILIIWILFWTITILIPILAKLFIEIVWPNKIPWFMLFLLDFNKNMLPILIQVGFIIWIFIIIKKILLTNSIILWIYEKAKLNIPLFWDILRTLEENRLFRILIQTQTSNLTEIQKIQSFEKATWNLLYKWLYRTMRTIYPSRRNLVTTIEEANNRFGWNLFGKRMITVLNLAQWDSKKVLMKYEMFLEKNTQILYEKLKRVNFFITVFATLFIALSITGIFWMIFSMVISLAKG